MRPNVTRYRIQWFLMTAVVQEFISRLERTTALLLAQELLTSKPWAYDTAIFSRNYETMNATLFTIMNDEAHNLRATFFFNKLVSHSQNIVLIPVRYSRIVHILSIFQCILFVFNLSSSSITYHSHCLLKPSPTLTCVSPMNQLWGSPYHSLLKVPN